MEQTNSMYVTSYLNFLVQAKFLYGSKFSPGEIHDLKLMIQINVYKYLSTLLEWRECFEDEALKQERELCTIDKAAG